jgi:hypothetical protein
VDAGDPAREDQNRSLVSIEVPVVARLALELEEDVAAEISVALDQVPPQPRGGGEGADPRPLHARDHAVALTRGADVVPFHPAAAGDAFRIARPRLQAGEAAMGDAALTAALLTRPAVGSAPGG